MNMFSIKILYQCSGLCNMGQEDQNSCSQQVLMIVASKIDCKCKMLNPSVWGDESFL